MKEPYYVYSTTMAMVMWVSSEGVDILKPDPDAMNTIRYCFFDGSTWSEPGMAATGIAAIFDTALAYDGSLAIYVYAADTDYDRGTIEEMELFALVINIQT